jgi:ubiquinone/menaquinone biosynthesis C-methylase UbiE
MADAHALPFADATFDRVFHVGAVNSYRDPKLALTEMTRVAKPGVPALVVDQWLDRSQPPRLRDRLVYRAAAAYDAKMSHPSELLPAGVGNVRMEQLNPVFYCLSFRCPDRQRGRHEASSVFRVEQ